MCTVTYIPAKEGIFITSNRDEQQGRPPALPPQLYPGRRGRLLFPKDTLAGGTWFALHERGSVLVLLNGAGLKHTPQPPCRKSRGLILLELADSPHSVEEFKKLNCSDIEPFTLILLEEGDLYEGFWDGREKLLRALDSTCPHIWSSVTLYDPAAIRKRKKWFEKWLQDNSSPDSDSVVQFHSGSGDGDPHNALLMNRDDKIFTVSITCLQLTDRCARMFYKDIQEGNTFTRELLLTTRTPAAL